MADENKDIPGPPPDPDEINPNAPQPPPARPTEAAAPTSTPAPEPSLHVGLIDESPKEGRLSVIMERIGDINAEVQGRFAGYVQDLPNPFEALRGLDVIGKLKITAILLLLVLLGVVIRYWGGQWLVIFKDSNVYSLTEKATEVIDLSPEEKFVEFDYDLLVPQYIVLLNRVVVNLKKSERSGANPMAAFNIFLHATNQETGVEIKERERELQDFVQRLTEDFSYDQLLTEGGKRKWKIVLKSEINMVLTKGKVKDIYFNTLLIKP